MEHENWIADMEKIGLPLMGLVFWDGQRIVIVTHPEMSEEAKESFARQLKAFQICQHTESVTEVLDRIEDASKSVQ